MWCEGELVEWFDDRGFGFAHSPTGGDRVFVHIKEFARGGQRRPLVGDLIEFQLRRDERGRAQAAMISYVSEPSPAITTGVRDVTVATVLCGMFGAALVAAIYFDHLPWWVSGLYVGLSLVSGWLYWLDKQAAQQGAWRVSEQQLLVVDLLGGWIGGLFAQTVFRHKTRKLSFLAAFWTIVAAHLLFWLVSRSDLLASV